MSVKMTFPVVFVTAVLSGVPAAAQEPPIPPPTSPPATGSPLIPEPAIQDPAPPAATSPIDLRRRRDAMLVMEDVLASHVRRAAERVAREIQAVQAGVGMFRTSVARARGVYLEGYGVVFHIEIPGVRPGVVNLIETLGRERMGQRSSPALTAAAEAVGPPSVLMDPDAAYVHAVKANLIDAMLDSSKSLELRADEWLALAARGDGEQFVPGEIVEAKTMILRIRGSHLADFLAGRLSREDALKRVEVREF